MLHKQSHMPEEGWNSVAQKLEKNTFRAFFFIGCVTKKETSVIPQDFNV